MQDSHSSHHTYTIYSYASYVANSLLISLILFGFVGILRHCTGLLLLLTNCVNWFKSVFCIQDTQSHLDIFSNIAHYSTSTRDTNIPVQIHPPPIGNLLQDNNFQSSVSGVSTIGKVVRFLVPTSSGPAGSVSEV